MKIDTLFKVIPIVMCTLALLGCEEVIEINLNSSDPKIVIEGTVTDQVGPYVVKISQTTDYYNPGDYPLISGADVTISDNYGNTDRLVETESGIYQTDSLQGIPGRTYSLHVELNGESYTAVSTMPVAIEIDSLYYTQEENGFRKDSDEQYEVTCVFTDRTGTDDFCRLKIYRNNAVEVGYALYNGRLSDGNVIEFDRFQAEFEENDRVKIQLYSIDPATYEYYSTLSEVLASDSRGIISTEVPANPVSNLSGDALGYFGAFTVRSDSIVIKSVY